MARFAASTTMRSNALFTFTPRFSRLCGLALIQRSRAENGRSIDPGESDDADWRSTDDVTEVCVIMPFDGHDLYAVASFLARTKSRLLAYRLRICWA